MVSLNLIQDAKFKRTNAQTIKQRKTCYIKYHIAEDEKNIFSPFWSLSDPNEDIKT